MKYQMLVNIGNLSGYDGASSNDWRVWTPIGTDEENAFAGSLDGGGHTISGLYMNDVYQRYVGLFGYVGIINSYFDGAKNVGGICGYSGGEIANCYYLSDDSAPGGINGKDELGKAEGKTAEQFKSGEICWLLNGEQTEIVYKQTLGTNTYPSFDGGIIYLNNGEYTNEIPPRTCGSYL